MLTSDFIIGEESVEEFTTLNIELRFDAPMDIGSGSKGIVRMIFLVFDSASILLDNVLALRTLLEVVLLGVDFWLTLCNEPFFSSSEGAAFSLPISASC